MCTLVFLMSCIRFGFRSSLVMFDKNTIFCRFLSFFEFAFKSLCFLCWPFLLLVLFFFVFFLLVVVGQIKLLCSVFCFCYFGFPSFGSVLCVVFFLVCFWFGFFLGGFKGQVRWPKGPPQLALNPPYLFCFVFGLFLFVLF